MQQKLIAEFEFVLCARCNAFFRKTKQEISLLRYGFTWACDCSLLNCPRTVSTEIRVSDI